MNIDNVFWDIIDEQENKNMPLSFRGDAVFCVWAINLFKFRIDIHDELNPQPEIKELLKTIDKKVFEKSNIIKSTTDFRTEMLENEKSNCVGILTSFIEQHLFENALSKIEEYKSLKFNPVFSCGNKDFYDLAKEYCIKNTL